MAFSFSFSGLDRVPISPVRNHPRSPKFEISFSLRSAFAAACTSTARKQLDVLDPLLEPLQHYIRCANFATCPAGPRDAASRVSW